MNGLEKIKKHPILICLIALLLLIIIPFCINLLFKWHTGVLLEWEDTAGAMLEFYGAVLGGGVTLLVLWITTDETRKIQQKNEQQLEDDRNEREREKRKAFVDSIIDDVSKFVADVTVFADKYRNYDKALKDKNGLEAVLEKTSKEIVDIYKDAAEKEDADFSHVAREKELQEKKEKIIRKIELCNKQIEIASIEASRIVALEKYTALCIKLRGIEEEDQILDRMEKINSSARNATIEFQVIGDMIDELLDVVDAFAKRYIEEG